jgi:hypothetical protein
MASIPSTSLIQTRSATRAKQITSIPSASLFDSTSAASSTPEETYPFVDLPIEIVNNVVFKAVNAENWEKSLCSVRKLLPVVMQLSTYFRNVMREIRYSSLNFSFSPVSYGLTISNQISHLFLDFIDWSQQKSIQYSVFEGIKRLRIYDWTCIPQFIKCIPARGLDLVYLYISSSISVPNQKLFANCLGDVDQIEDWSGFVEHVNENTLASTTTIEIYRILSDDAMERIFNSSRRLESLLIYHNSFILDNQITLMESPLKSFYLRHSGILTSFDINHVLNISKLSLLELTLCQLSLQTFNSILDMLCQCHKINKLFLDLGNGFNFQLIVNLIRHLPEITSVSVTVNRFENVTRESIEAVYMMYYKGHGLVNVDYCVEDDGQICLLTEIRDQALAVYEKDPRFSNKMPLFGIDD